MHMIRARGARMGRDREIENAGDCRLRRAMFGWALVTCRGAYICIYATVNGQHPAMVHFLCGLKVGV